MAKLTSGLTYFPLDTTNTRALQAYICEFGNKGFGVYIRLTQEIFGREGYYMSIDKHSLLSLADEYKVSYNSLCEIIRALVRYGIYDKQMYEDKQILTSSIIQRYYLHAKRTDIALQKDYILESIIPYVSKLQQNQVEKRQKAQRKEKQTKSNNNINNTKESDNSYSNQYKQGLSLIEKFTTNYPKIYVGTEHVPNFVDMDKLIEHYKINTWLHNKSNITLKWLMQKQNYDKVIADCYKGDTQQITIIQKNSTTDNCDELFDNNNLDNLNMC